MFFLDRDLWECYKLQDIQDDVRENRHQAIAATRRSEESAAALAENVARTALLLHSLVETLVRKGLVAREEISAVFQELDLLDGQADGKLAQAPTAADNSPDRASTPEEFLRKLERE
jgi:hypothetical protein